MYEHLSTYYDQLQRIEEYSHYNPIQDHIQISFLELEELSFIDQLVRDLKQAFNPELSRVIVFVSSRKKTEAFSDIFNNEPGHNYQSAYYHAGMDAEQRQTVYGKYKSGDITVLFATKAFGMGMDIPNIHFLYHFGPSSNIEDFLQEIGRAGRNKEARQKAGFSGSNQIITRCFFSEDHFQKIRDLVQKRQIGWAAIKEVEKELKSFFRKCGIKEPDKETPLPVPLDLLNSAPYFFEEKNTSAIFRLATYWLEKAGRFRQRYYVPGLLEFSGEYSSEEEVEGSEEKAFLKLFPKYDRKEDSIWVPIKEIYEVIEKKSLSRVFSLIIKLHKNNKVQLKREVSVAPFDKLHKREIQEYGKSKDELIIFSLFALIELLRDLLKEIPIHSRKEYSKEDIAKKGEKVFDQFFKEEAFSVFWQDKKPEEQAEKKERYRKKEKKDFLERRTSFAFYILNQIPLVKAENKIEKEEKQVYTVVYKNTSDEEVNRFLNNYKKQSIRLIQFVSSRILSNQLKFDLYDFIQSLNFVDISLSRLSFLFTTWQRLGYFQLKSSLLPMAIEMFLLDTENLDEEKNEADRKQLDDFKTTIALKKLRLLVLESLQRLPQEKHDAYIKSYFKCASFEDIVNLISEYDRAAELDQFREEALEREMALLNEDQRKIFDFSLDKNLLVKADPGTGKTHTLIMRVAKLIQRDHIPPAKILILAYNRSVVQELKSRLKRLFDGLGYRTITYELRVYTFHGLIKTVLNGRIKEAEAAFPKEDQFRAWEKYFIQLSKEEPGYITSALGMPKYLFVDEFQDITTNRLEILKAISTKGLTKLTVIGDPVQSIYGYERKDVGDPINPGPYYEKFREEFEPDELQLTVNYRSYQEIIDHAQERLKHQLKEYKMEALKSNKGSSPEAVQFVDLTHTPKHWEDHVSDFLNSSNPDRELAILFRTNAELFRSFAKIRKKELGETRIYIQSSNDEFFRTRELSYFVDHWKARSAENIDSKLLGQLIAEIQEKAGEMDNWEQVGLKKLQALLLEYGMTLQDNQTIRDLIDYLEDFSRRDDGVLWNIYARHFDLSNEKRIILSTIHKAKGLEFESVLILPSYHVLENKEDGYFTDQCLEEERLLFVAATRAKRKLFHYIWKREKAILLKEP